MSDTGIQLPIVFSELCYKRYFSKTILYFSVYEIYLLSAFITSY